MQIYDFRRKIHISGSAMADFQVYRAETPSGADFYYKKYLEGE